MNRRARPIPDLWRRKQGIDRVALRPRCFRRFGVSPCEADRVCRRVTAQRHRPPVGTPQSRRPPPARGAARSDVHRVWSWLIVLCFSSPPQCGYPTQDTPIPHGTRRLEVRRWLRRSPIARCHFDPADCSRNGAISSHRGPPRTCAGLTTTRRVVPAKRCVAFDLARIERHTDT
jgi:hypothetical protein